MEPSAARFVETVEAEPPRPATQQLNLGGVGVATCAPPGRRWIGADKPMRNHTLMQTIARANRVFPGKHSGVNAVAILDDFHTRAGRAFRWCIRPVLHERLEPLDRSSGHARTAHRRRRPSKYPPAKPGALVLEPLKAACPCRTRQSVPSTLWNAPRAGLGNLNKAISGVSA